MGQYYKPINLDKKQYVYSHDITTPWKCADGQVIEMGSGLKLMEHSWRLNPFVNAVAALLLAGNAWSGNRIVWAGDYADPEKTETPGDEQNLYDLIDDDVDLAMKIIPSIPKRRPRYFHNLDTNEFVDVCKCPEEDPNDIGCNIHPLPLLTCEGNGRGGGDFRGENSYLGVWARNRIVASYTKPKKAKEITPNFTEQSVLMFKKPKVKKTPVTA